jgi:cystathionine gamma-synthase/methionine-gamma-lyase
MCQTAFMSERRAATIAIHAGERKPPADHIPVATPIYSDATFIYDRLESIDQIAGGERHGFTYTRHDNPTTACFEEAVADLEEASLAVGFASGMSALYLALLAAGVQKGSRILAARDLYGVTVKLLTDVCGASGAEVRFGDTMDLAELERELAGYRPNVLLVESISNPLLRVCDLEKVCAAARRHEARVVVDSTFATPILVRPLTLGADLVVHSATKYLGGHGDLVGGVVAARESYRQPLKYFSRLIGPVLGPFEAWLARRGMKTLPLRMERHCSNAARVAAWLDEHSKVERVNYPGLAGHPDHLLAGRLFDGMYGGNVSFEICGAGREQIFKFINALKLCVPATSLGDVHSMILYPAISSHRDLAPKTRERLGIRDNLVRLSVGLEDIEDILEDLGQALGRASA